MIITNMDAWDRRTFIESMENDSVLSAAEREGSRKVPNYAEFMSDIYAGLYKYAPQTRKIEDAPAGDRWADTMYNEISQLPEWKVLRERTRMNPEAASAATAEFCMAMTDNLPDKNTILDFSHKDLPSSDAEVTMKNPREEMIDEFMAGVRHAARGACEQATKIADETIETLNAMGFDSSNGTPAYASPTQKKEIAAALRNNDHLRNIALMTGRMRRIALDKQKSKTPHGVDELADITVGDDLARLLPAEMMKLRHPLLKLDFQRKYLEKNLMQYQLRGREKQGRGPLVVCIDESGSMRGQRDVWAKAVALALLQVAQQQNRHYAMIHFNTGVARVDNFKGKANPAEIMDAVAHFSGGGTDFELPLTEAANIIINKDKDFKKADIVFITDDNNSVREEWLDKFSQLKKIGEFSVTSVCIAANSSTCEKFSDKVVNISEVTEDDEALQAVFTV